MTKPMKTKTCPNCGSTMVQNACAACGYSRPSMIARTAFLKINAREIADDIAVLGVVGTIRKWHIGTCSFYHIPEVRAVLEERRQRRVTCCECDYTWTPKVESPKVCPSCKRRRHRSDQIGR